jgi:hypothetical protein
MKLFLPLCAIGLLAGSASAADLGDTKTVYLLPMASGLDQFLAIRLTTGALLQVVTDPQKADAVLTDKIGAAFEQRLDELYNPVQKKDDKDAVFGDPGKPAQSISRGKGAIFLVDRKTRNVLWSTYARPKNATPDEMNHLADRIASRLEKDRKGK